MNRITSAIGSVFLIASFWSGESLAQATDVECDGCADSTDIADGAVRGRDAEIVVGRWLDKPIPNISKYDGILEIVETDSGTVEMRRIYGDGSSSITMLRKDAEGVYLAEGNNLGEGYRIIPTSGDLQLFDNEGEIRVASRSSQTPWRANGEPAEKRNAPKPAAPSSAGTRESGDIPTAEHILQLRQLADLRDRGVVTEEQFIRIRTAILERSRSTTLDPMQQSAVPTGQDHTPTPKTADEEPNNFVAPVYPARALARGIEGYVDFEFTISITGQVVDPVILYSTDKVFDRSAMRAIKKYQYDSRRVPTHGVTARIEFVIRED